MRLLERILTTQANLNVTAIDTAARGARAAMITLQPAGAGITDQMTIDDLITDPVSGTIVNRVALWFFDGVDSQQGSYVYTPLFGDTLRLSNTSGGSIRSYVYLYDEPTDAPHGSFTRYLRASTLAALATFTSPDMAVGRFGQTYLTIQTDRAADIFVDMKTTTAGVYIPIAQGNIPGAGGGVFSGPVNFYAPVFRVRVRNNDGALLMTYNVSMYVPPFVS